MTHTITIVGLGNYGIDELPLGIYRFLEKESMQFLVILELLKLRL